jgi:hypothetical protein
MSLSDVTKQILKIYNTKFDQNEKEEEDLEKEVKLNEEQLLKKYNDILLCCNSGKPISNIPDDERDEIDPIKLMSESNQLVETNNSKDVCNVICKMNYIEDKSFINKMMIYRIAEIKKRLMFIKYNIEIYKLIITDILNLQYKIESGYVENNDEVKDELNQLNFQKGLVMEYLDKYVIESEKYIINTSICKFLFLQDRYKKLVG